MDKVSDFEAVVQDITKDRLYNNGVNDINEYMLTKACDIAIDEHIEFIVQQAVVEYYLVKGEIEKALKLYEKYKKSLREYIRK